jgi:hypothetical protein
MYILRSNFRDPDTCIHRGMFLRVTYMHLERGILAMGIYMEAYVETLTWAYTEGHF